jgi:hypothetical protein
MVAMTDMQFLKEVHFNYGLNGEKEVTDNSINRWRRRRRTIRILSNQMRMTTLKKRKKQLTTIENM